MHDDPFIELAVDIIRDLPPPAELRWSQSQAIELCVKVESVCPKAGCHVALTGGCLYKLDGSRKDCDLLFYRIRQVESIDRDTLFDLLASIGITTKPGTILSGWCVKARYAGRALDIFFPEDDSGDQRY